MADNIVCDSVKACQAEAGDFAEALEKGIFDWSRAVDLCDVIAGKAHGGESIVAVWAELLDRDERPGVAVEGLRQAQVGEAVEERAHCLASRRAGEKRAGDSRPSPHSRSRKVFVPK